MVSRVVPDEQLDETALEIAHSIASNSAFAVKMFRQVLGRMERPLVQRSLAEEALAQSLVFASHDYREQKTARTEQRDPNYRGR